MPFKWAYLVGKHENNVKISNVLCCEHDQFKNVCNARNFFNWNCEMELNVEQSRKFYRVIQLNEINCDRVHLNEERNIPSKSCNTLNEKWAIFQSQSLGFSMSIAQNKT